MLKEGPVARKKKSGDQQTRRCKWWRLIDLKWVDAHRAGDNTEKIWVHWFLTKPKAITAGGLGGAVSPQGALGDALVKAQVQSS